MNNIIHVRNYTRRKPLPSADFVATTKALAAHVLEEREWNAFVGEVLAMGLAAELADPLDALDMDEDMRVRIREGGP